MNKENCALKLVDEIILYYDARSKKHQITQYYDLLGSHHIVVWYVREYIPTRANDFTMKKKLFFLKKSCDKTAVFTSAP